jgi:formate/nitrite transporter
VAALFGVDAYSPQEIAERVENVGVTKARLPALATFTLAVLAGGFIGLGALYFTLVTSDVALSFALSRTLGGLCFSLGLILVVIAGAELFTGNNLLVMAWAAGRITLWELLRNWALVLLGNATGAVGLAVLVVLAGQATLNEGEVGRHAVQLAALKVTLPFWTAFFRGVLCNVLVCLAVWLAMAGRSVTDKLLAVIFPISAFVAAGFEHSVANLYLIPLGMLLESGAVSFTGLLRNLVPVTLGNIVGGAGMVALVYTLVYRRGIPPTTTGSHMDQTAEPPRA